MGRLVLQRDLLCSGTQPRIWLMLLLYWRISRLLIYKSSRKLRETTLRVVTAFWLRIDFSFPKNIRAIWSSGSILTVILYQNCPDSLKRDLYDQSWSLHWDFAICVSRKGERSCGTVFWSWIWTLRRVHRLDQVGFSCSCCTELKFWNSICTCAGNLMF